MKITDLIEKLESINARIGDLDVVVCERGRSRADRIDWVEFGRITEDQLGEVIIVPDGTDTSLPTAVVLRTL